MLEELRITGLGVIEDRRSRSTRGLTVVTGETGAGKTMVVTGLGLLFGGRADAGRVRAEPGRAVVEGRLRLPADSPALAARVVDAGGELDDDGALLLSRTVTVEGRSRAHVGGRSGAGGDARRARRAACWPCTASPTSCGCCGRPSSAPRWTGSPAPDARSCSSALPRGVRALARGWPTTWPTGGATPASAPRRPTCCGSAWTRSPRSSRSPARTTSWRPRRSGWSTPTGCGTAAQTAHSALAGDPADRPTRRRTRPRCSAPPGAPWTRSRPRPGAGGAGDRLDELANLVADVARRAGGLRASALDADPARLAAVYERRAALTALTRKYGDATARRRGARLGRARPQRLAELDTSDDALAALRRGAATRLRGRGRPSWPAALSAARREAADRFAEAVTVELAGLAMPHARSRSRCRRRRPGGPALAVDGAAVRLGPDGVDEVELLLRPHPGAPPLPLQRAPPAASCPG